MASLAIWLVYITVVPTCARFSSAREMRSARIGTYACTATTQVIILDSDTVTYTWSGDDYVSLKFSIVEWDYEDGMISANGGDLTLKSDGDIMEGGNTYQKTSFSTKAPSKEEDAWEKTYHELAVWRITDDSVTRNSGYMVCTGKVTNNRTRTYLFVKVKVSSLDSCGNVVDTDWSYASGAKGLAPGEVPRPSAFRYLRLRAPLTYRARLPRAEGRSLVS